MQRFHYNLSNPGYLTGNNSDQLKNASSGFDGTVAKNYSELQKGYFFVLSA
uniref:hypothetical protein n=1 Tax=Piscirickettsia salmonis TaxID=1238 RepID=UPI0039F67273